MTITYHPEFPQDIKKFEAQYRDVSLRLGSRFRTEVKEAIEHIRVPQAIFSTRAL